MRRYCCCHCHCHYRRCWWFFPHFCCIFFLTVRCNCLIIDFWHISSQKRPATTRPVPFHCRMMCNALVVVPLNAGGTVPNITIYSVCLAFIVWMCVLAFCSFFIDEAYRIFMGSLSFVQSHSKSFLTLTLYLYVPACMCASYSVASSVSSFFPPSDASTQRSKWIKSNFDCIIKSVPPF